MRPCGALVTLLFLPRLQLKESKGYQVADEQKTARGHPEGDEAQNRSLRKMVLRYRPSRKIAAIFDLLKMNGRADGNQKNTKASLTGKRLCTKRPVRTWSLLKEAHLEQAMTQEHLTG